LIDDGEVTATIRPTTGDSHIHIPQVAPACIMLVHVWSRKHMMT